MDSRPRDNLQYLAPRPADSEQITPLYVFLGIDFAILYDIIQRVDSGAFVAAATELPSVFYFSFTTLTTVGYGDITPVSGWAQALTVVEALTGQILLVVIVARLVGMQIAQHHRPLVDSIRSSDSNTTTSS